LSHLEKLENLSLEFKYIYLQNIFPLRFALNPSIEPLILALKSLNYLESLYLNFEYNIILSSFIFAILDFQK